MLQERDDIVALDSAILQHPRVWEASGHVAGFTDPLVDCQTCKPALPRRPPRRARSARRSRPSTPARTGSCDLTEAREFNLMFETTVGPVKDSGSVAYLRPETAQGIFINFKNVLQFSRKKPPFGIAQVGKSFRNEITPGQLHLPHARVRADGDGVLRPAGRGRRVVRRTGSTSATRWYTELGIRPDHLRMREHDADELSHYSSRHARRRVPLPDRLVASSRASPTAATSTSRQHAEFSGEKLEYFDQGRRASATSRT